MLKDAQRRRFDVVMAWVIDRLDPLLNRPAGYDPSVGGMRPAIEERIHAQLRSKKGMLAIARDLKVRTGTVQRVKREMEAAGPFEGAAAA
jgi:DNA invertase Pin-like site-specific DNA recombinase